MTKHAVVISGAGPTGLMLAAELALAAVDVAIVERRPEPGPLGSRGLGLQSRTLELFDQRGVADRFLSEGLVAQIQGFAGVPLDLSDFPTRHPYGLALRQDRVEELMAEWVDGLPVRIYRGREVTGFAQDDAGVDIRFEDGEPMRADYLVGCDGGRSVIRKTAGIAFPGVEPTTTSLVAEVAMTEEPELGFKRDEKGTHAIGKLGDGELLRLVVSEAQVERGAEPTLAELSAALKAVYGTDFGVHSPTWMGRFGDGARQAASYREGRVLLAGDSAHVHSPVGGQGLHTGAQDAVNLGWKLAQVVHGTSPDTLLDTYHAERHPAGARVLQGTLAQTAMMRGDERTEALRSVLSEVLVMDGPRKHLAGMLSGLDVHFDLGDGHPLVGRRVPDLELTTDGGPVRVFSLLHQARPAFINLATLEAFDVAPWADRVPRVDATYDGPWELPVLGEVDAPDALLVRPDGFVAWAGQAGDPELPRALSAWFGTPVAAG